jgi:hypothetical protein
LFVTQTGSGHINCLTLNNCLLCNCASLLHNFFNTKQTETKSQIHSIYAYVKTSLSVI